MSPAPIDESRLRHPNERPLFIAAVVLNVAILVAAVLLVAYGGAWLASYPRIAKYVDQLRTLAVAALLAPPALIFLRNARHARVRGDSVRVSSDQLPEMYAALEQHCAAVGETDPPELYVTERAIAEYSGAYSTWRSRYIVLGNKFLETNLARVRDVYEFTIARELGRLRLGHTEWWDELLLAYVLKIPVLRNPLLRTRTLSLDRYGAALAPHGVRGLAIQASGRLLLFALDVDEYVRQAREYRGYWTLLALVREKSPPVALRVRELVEGGFLAVDGRTQDAAAGREAAPV